MKKKTFKKITSLSKKNINLKKFINYNILLLKIGFQFKIKF